MTDVSAGFRPPCWCPSRWAPTWRLYTNLCKFGKNVSPHISHKKNCFDLHLGETLCISTFFLFPDSRLNLLNGFEFLFWSIWMAWHWKPAIRLFEGTETVSCRLSLRLAWMEMDWILKKIGQFFQVLMLRIRKSSRNLLWLALFDKIHLISSP